MKLISHKASFKTSTMQHLAKGVKFQIGLDSHHQISPINHCSKVFQTMEMHHTFYKQYVTTFQNYRLYSWWKVHGVYWGQQAHEGEWVCAWIIHHHHFWKLEYGGQKLVAWCRLPVPLGSKHGRQGHPFHFIINLGIMTHKEWVCPQSLQKHTDSGKFIHKILLLLHSPAFI